MTSQPIFSNKQKRIYLYDRDYCPRITIMEGAVRSGKTCLNNYLWIKHVIKYKNQGLKFIMTGSTIASLKRNVLDDLDAIFDLDCRLNKHNEFILFGNTVSCFGADKADSYRTMKGFTAHGWYANEITEHHINSVDQAVKRCSGGGARFFWDTNPSYPNHHIKINYIDRDGEKLEDGRVHIKSWHFVLDDNIFLPKEYVESLKSTTPTGMWYDRDILGLWVSAEGMIFKDFDYSKHIIDEAPDELRDYFAGVDWGYDHHGVIGVYAMDYDGRAFRLYEIAEREKGIDFWLNIAKEIKEKHGNIPFYCDPSRKDYIADFKKAGIVALRASNPVVEGIGFVASLFKKDRYSIVKSGNPRTLEEIYSYRWRQGGSEEAPIKEDDDAMDSGRYALYTHIGKSRILKPPKNVKHTEKTASKVQNLPSW